MSPFLRQAEEILETAISGSGEIAIVIGHRGLVHLLDPTGWSLPAMRVEYGAATVFRVERRNGRVMVEGRDGSRRCRLEKAVPPDYITRYSVERSEGAERWAL